MRYSNADVERTAIALFERVLKRRAGLWEHQGDYIQNHYRDMAECALRAFTRELVARAK